LRATYRDATRGLVAGGADVLMIETVFDTLNCKAAIFAIEEVSSNSISACRCGYRAPSPISPAAP